jgi:heme/copper-type cytochrome/quinol oxidase subunit 4
MKLTTRLIIIVTIVVTITDLVEYIHLKQHPERLTIPYVFLIIIVTVVPIAVNIWYWLRKQEESR